MIEEVPHGVCLNTWVREVQEAAFFLGKIETKKVTSPRARSRYVLQAKLLALEIKALPKDAIVGFRFRSPLGVSTIRTPTLASLGSALISRANNLA